jgi:hypothetical protein
MPSILQYDNAIKRAQAAGDVEAAQILSQQLDALMAKEYGYTVRQGSDSGFFEDIASGFGAGAVGMAESAALGTAALLEEEEELKAREKIQSIAKSLRPEGGDPESITYKLSSGIGSIAGMALPAAAAAYAAPAAATTAVGLGVAGALGVGAGAGEASERARKFGATEEERGMATLRGAAIGSLEVLPLGKILRVPGVTGLMEKLGEGGVGLVNRLRKMAVTGTAEGVQEATSAILQNLNARGYDPEAELINAGVLEEGAIGGGSGAIVQGLVDLFVKGKTRTPPGTTEPTDGPAPEVDQPRLEEDQVQGSCSPLAKTT